MYWFIFELNKYKPLLHDSWLKVKIKIWWLHQFSVCTEVKKLKKIRASYHKARVSFDTGIAVPLFIEEATSSENHKIKLSLIINPIL